MALNRLVTQPTQPLNLKSLIPGFKHLLFHVFNLYRLRNGGAPKLNALGNARNSPPERRPSVGLCTLIQVDP
jgi:hypothetical protein